jgi:diguanylate cyclase (GGDEF)-like protein
MNLSKRALLIILPVFLASFAFASLVVYDQAKRFVLRQEQERLEFATMQLGSAYEKYQNFINGYQLSVTDSHAFHQLLQETSNLSRRQSLTASMTENFQAFAGYRDDLIGVTIARNSEPMEILAQYTRESAIEEQVAQQLIASLRASMADTAETHWDHIVDTGQRSAIIRNLRITPPTNDAVNGNTVSFQVAMEPTRFNDLCEQLKRDLNASFQIVNTAPTLAPMQASVNLRNGEYLLAQLSGSHLSNQLQPLIQRLILISVLFSIVASVCLHLLMRRYVTRPVSLLEQDLADVVSRRWSELPVREGNDEISKLSRTFGKLYGDLAQAYRDLRRLNQRDPLTGLYNLGHVTDSVVEHLNLAKTNSDELTLIYLDLDNFKHINDKFGHKFGNSLLCSFAKSMNSLTTSAKDQSTHEQPPEIIAGRVGGDQFCFLILHPTAFLIARKLAEDILALTADGIMFEQNRFSITVSIGIATYPSDCDTASQLISNADTATHQAKLHGKNQIALYSEELAQNSRRQQEIESHLKNMDPDSEFTLVYMPLVNVRTDQLDGFEALLRWDSPKLGSVDPEEFVPIAEACGVFATIDEWVIRTGLSNYPTLKSQLGRDFKLSLNISSAQLLMSNLIEVLDRYVALYDVPTQYVQLEITETVNIEYTAYAGAFLNSLSEKGYSLALDDFGSGFTSLMRIVEYPLNMVKFDKNFIQQTLKKDNRQILKPLVDLCHLNGILVTMEGAETQEDIDLLRSFDCDYIQGYFLGRPIELGNMEALIAKYQN